MRLGLWKPQSKICRLSFLIPNELDRVNGTKQRALLDEWEKIIVLHVQKTQFDTFPYNTLQSN